MANLSQYEKELKETYVEKEECVAVGDKTYVCVLKIKGGFELVGYATDNAIDKSFSDEEIEAKACKNAYESLEAFDRFHRSTNK